MASSPKPRSAHIGRILWFEGPLFVTIVSPRSNWGLPGCPGGLIRRRMRSGHLIPSCLAPFDTWLALQVDALNRLYSSDLGRRKRALIISKPNCRETLGWSIKIAKFMQSLGLEVYSGQSPTIRSLEAARLAVGWLGRPPIWSYPSVLVHPPARAGFVRLSWSVRVGFCAGVWRGCPRPSRVRSRAARSPFPCPAPPRVGGRRIRWEPRRTPRGHGAQRHLPGQPGGPQHGPPALLPDLQRQRLDPALGRRIAQILALARRLATGELPLRCTLVFRF